MDFQLVIVVQFLLRTISRIAGIKNGILPVLSVNWIAFRESILPPMHLTLTETDLGFKSGFLDWSETGFCRMAAKMSWFHSVVSVSYFAEFCENRPVTVCMRNANKSPKMPYFWNGEESGKVIRNPHPGLDHHQKFNKLFPLVGPAVIPNSMQLAGYFCRQTDAQTDRQTPQKKHNLFKRLTLL